MPTDDAIAYRAGFLRAAAECGLGPEDLGRLAQRTALVKTGVSLATAMLALSAPAMISFWLANRAGKSMGRWAAGLFHVSGEEAAIEIKDRELAAEYERATRQLERRSRPTP